MTPTLIILPTAPIIQRFIEMSSRMTIVDYDLEEVMSVVVDVLSVETDREAKSLQLMNTYSDFTPDYEQDAIIIRNALQAILGELQALITSHQLRDRFGYFHYVFEKWHNHQYDAILRYRQ